MKLSTKLGLFAGCGATMFVLVVIASAAGSAIPLFFVWIPAAGIMLIEKRSRQPA